MIEIDGSYGEGGGQILRIALALASITGKSVHIKNIRKGRNPAGLLQQHLTCVKAAAKISNASAEGIKFGSQELWFEPGNIIDGQFSFDVAEEKGSAGATTLVLQTILPILLYANEPSVVSIKGGTHTNWSPSFHYIQKVLQPTLNKLGIDFEVSLLRWGFYPIGKGELEVMVKPMGKNQIKGIGLVEHGSFEKLRGISVVSGLPISIAERQANEAKRVLKDFYPEIGVSKVTAYSKGTFFFLLAEFENTLAGFSSLGERGKPAEKVAREACNEFLYYYNSGQAIDQWLADQIIPYLALAREKSVFTTSRISNHLLTNIWVITKFLDTKIEVQGELGHPGKVELNT
ncbi:MAG: RNA 3'-terminal phosphate cyclase [bacterium]|nr:RNA 3'-terminal phosphate cyclase [bacterium]